MAVLIYTPAIGVRVLPLFQVSPTLGIIRLFSICKCGGWVVPCFTNEENANTISSKELIAMLMALKMPQILSQPFPPQLREKFWP